MPRTAAFFLTLACAIALHGPAQAQSKVKPAALPVIMQKQAPPPAPAVKRYRVSITGFEVEQATWDDAMQRDGKDDEIFLMAEWRELYTSDGTPHVGPAQTVRSMVMGDINGFQPEERLQAGHASDEGGIRAGDKVGTIGNRRGEPRKDRIPLLIWEGELQPDMAVMIVPTIWEWDGAANDLDWLGTKLLEPINTFGDGEDRIAWEAAEPLGRRDFPQFVHGEIRRYSEMEVGRNVIGTHVVQEAHVVGTKADRPIGMDSDNGTFRFDPWVLTLGLGTIEGIARNNMGYGYGVIRLPYIDAPALRGRYQLHLQVEEMP
jgi:hypothetical protein